MIERWSGNNAKEVGPPGPVHLVIGSPRVEGVMRAHWLSSVAGAALLLSMVSACHRSTVSAGQRTCETVLDCPAGWTCDLEAGYCVPVEGLDAALDAGDGGPGDAGRDAGDAALVDAALDVELSWDAAEPDGDVDAGPASCLYVPTPGEFTPTMECWWGEPVDFSAYNDVVMAPVVANVTDDDADGRIDTDDVPDIIFASYRYEQDGCCATPALLRVVSGRCNADATKLEEHFVIENPKLDNSGGLAVGDIDGDGRPEIVGMRWISGHTTYGTVAFSSVIYDSFFPEQDSVRDADWQVNPAGPAYGAVSEDPPDGPATVIFTDRPGAQGFTWTWGMSSSAVAMVRVEARAAVSGGDAQLALMVRSGDATAVSEPSRVVGGQPFERFIGEFRVNPFNGGHHWADSDLDGLEFGVVRTDDATTTLQVTQVRITVGYVVTKWISPYPSGDDAYTAAQPAIADLDGDGIGEVIVGRVVLDGVTGNLKWRGRDGRGINSFMGPISIAADLDQDGVMEVIAGNTAYRADGVVEWTYDYPAHGDLGCAGSYPCDGYNATGNFDSDPEGEVVSVREGDVFVFNHDGSLLAKVHLPWIDCSRNEGGPPTVADFDADGRPEIGVAGADYYSVIDLDCCDDLPDCTTIPQGATDCSDPGIRWKVPNEDCSSRVTGSSVFDFDGDGSAEVVYNDECHFRIFSGFDGTVLFEEPNHSHTRLEYTVIADTDNDGNAEIVFIENGWCSATRCGTCDPTTPIQIWGDGNDSWVPTRRIWNEHTYHITNITEDGLLPPGGEVSNWRRYNNYRQNMPDYNVFAAPDLTVSITGYERRQCPSFLEIQALVCNEGDLRVGAGVEVTFYDADTGQAIECRDPVVTQGTIKPGRCEAVACLWPDPPRQPSRASVRACVDNGTWDCTEDGANHECHEDNNADDYSDNGCSGNPG